MRRKRVKASSLQQQLAQQIIDHIRRHDLPKGHHLPEEALAQELEVSRSPVRNALGLLAGRGILSRHVNRGFFLAHAAGELAPDGEGSGEAGEEALYLQIARDLFTGRLDGQVSEADILRRYGTTRSRVLRPLLRLCEEGLARRSPGRGWTFLPTLNSPESHDQSYRFRIAVEPSGILEPNFTPDPGRFARTRRAHLELLSSNIAQVPGSRLFAIDAEFHEMVAACSSNIFILQAVRQQNRLRRLVEYDTYRDPERTLNSCREHLGVLDALLSGDREWAAQLLRRHLEVSRDFRPSFVQTEPFHRPQTPKSDG